LDEPPIDPALATIIVRWPTLPDDVRRAIVAMVETATPYDNGPKLQ
jgi:hypothetical protein